METHPSNQAVFFLLILTVILLITIIVRLEIAMRKSRRIHEQKINLLKEMVVHLLENQQAQNVKIRLSDELKEKLQEATRTLSSELVSMIHEFIETLTQNNLLKK